MRFPFIRTTQTAIAALKKQARNLRKADGRPYQEALETVAVAARYLHWKHVAWCAEETKTFVGPLQPVFDPFVEEVAQPLSDQFILLSVSDGPAGDVERERARREGVRVSEDGRFLMFPHDVENEDEPEALCMSYSDL